MIYCRKELRTSKYERERKMREGGKRSMTGEGESTEVQVRGVGGRRGYPQGREKSHTGKDAQKGSSAFLT